MCVFRNIPLNIYNVTKIVATFVIVCVNITEFIETGVHSKDQDVTVSPVDYTMDTVFLLGSLCSLAMLLLSLRYGVQTSPAQFIYYLLSVVCGAFSFR